MSSRTIKIKYVRSSIGRPQKQKRTVQCLGFGRLNQVVERPDTPEVRGMVAKIAHLVKIVDEEGS